MWIKRAAPLPYLPHQTHPVTDALAYEDQPTPGAGTTDPFRIVDDRQVMVHLRLKVKFTTSWWELPTFQGLHPGGRPGRGIYDFQARVNHQFFGLTNFILGFHHQIVEVLEPEGLKAHLRGDGQDDGMVGLTGYGERKTKIWTTGNTSHWNRESGVPTLHPEPAHHRWEYFELSGFRNDDRGDTGGLSHAHERGYTRATLAYAADRYN